ncbi:nitroreductase family protein [Mycolicibacterium pyrenivorans]|uniref:nitroreductase family protein n=1 Tax=Mycolicibacterium pyrenivorans TaxID=187102 RepID=UPI0021F2E686|nr:nitroreductase family protein [Mycolicibacterium pyrenivorans]MCV7150125.1 nitroreductase family protein [Mycolicibacterium pyrenivorans]
MDTAITDHLLTTTRAVRRRLDLNRQVPTDVLLECVSVAQQAPTGSNLQGWRFVVVQDAAKRAALAEIYRRSIDQHRAVQPDSFSPNDSQTKRVYDSADYLVEVMDQVPTLVVPCIKGRPESLPHAYASVLYASICPAVWSFMLALRSRGVGSSWTTMHLLNEPEVAELLGIPKKFTQVALIPVAYYTGTDFRPASRPPAETITYFDSWGEARNG